jgi:pimeloyl-ACP methyl ester carboxylesterase
MQESFTSHANLELCIQTFGEKQNPAIILIAGAAGQGILWNIKLCQNLAKAGYFVIRFDNRDTGKSSGLIFDETPYNLKDMAEDVIAILDGLSIKKAHIIGMSMGGYITQFLASHFPDRILTITLIMSTINSLSLRGVRKVNNLPGQNPEVIRKIAQMYQIPRLNLEDRIKSLTDIWQLFNGSECEFPYDEWHELAKESYARAKSKNAVKNHRLAVLNSPADRTELLKNIEIPILIIHGEADPIIHIQHAYYIKDNLPAAKLFTIKKMGHILSSLFINQIEDILLEHFNEC